LRAFLLSANNACIVVGDNLEAFEKKVRNSFAKQLFMSTLGAELTSVTRGSTVIQFAFDDRLTQQNGFVHAGVITSVLDSACGYAALSVAPEEAEVLSVSLSLAPPSNGQERR
jgi:acyl-coenzyme A thioesterase PaaI-like protein